MTRGGRVAPVDDDAARQDQRLGIGFPANGSAKSTVSGATLPCIHEERAG